MSFLEKTLLSKAASTEENITEIYQQIIQEIATQDGSHDTSPYKIVEIAPEKSTTFSSVENSSKSQHAIQKITNNDGLISTETFFPYTYTNDGQMLNLLDLYATKYEEIHHEQYPAITLMDVTIKCTADYGYVLSSGYHYFAPVRTSITWISGEKVNNMSIRFVTQGNLCDSNQNDIPGLERYSHIISKNVSNPIMGTSYGSENRLNGNFIRPVDDMYDGGIIEFTVNNVQDSYSLFGKWGKND